MPIDRRFQTLVGIDYPIVQAPMAGAGGVELAVAVSDAGGLGSLPLAMRSADEARADMAAMRSRTPKPFNVNFFCHAAPRIDEAREAAWKTRLAPYYAEFGLDAHAAKPAGPAASRAPFDDAMADVVVDFRPAVVSFHFGLPEAKLLARVKATGAFVLATATSVDEALWLEAAGCDAVIAQGLEAGGHRGHFLTTDIGFALGTIALVPQVAHAVTIPVVAAGGIGNARGIAAALALGASAVQLGTAYLFSAEATLTAAHRTYLESQQNAPTVMTNVFTGRPARGFPTRAVRELGPLTGDAPEFPRAALAMAPLRAACEATGSVEFTPVWAGQAASLGRACNAGDLTRTLARGAGAILGTPYP